MIYKLTNYFINFYNHRILIIKRFTQINKIINQVNIQINTQIINSKILYQLLNHMMIILSNFKFNFNQDDVLKII